jgi:hypothetical protein
MAGTVGSNPTSQGTLPGRAAPIPTLERQESTQAETSIPGFGQAFSQAALTPSVLGEASSSVITKTGMAASERAGELSAQKNPNRQLMPSFTKSDEAFAAAYKSESSAQLGMQSQQLLDAHLEEIEKANQVTPELVDKLVQSSSQGIQGILANAPTEVRMQLSAQYAQRIQAESHRLNTNMIREQKKQSAQTAEAFRVTQSQNMQEAIRSNTAEGFVTAQQTRDSINENINQAEFSGNLTPSQADSARIANKLNYESGIQINKALEARRNGTMESFVAKMADKRLPGLTWAETESVQTNVLQAMGQVERADQRNRSLLLSEGNNLIQTGQMTPDRLASYEPDLTPAEFNNLSTSYAVSKHGASQKEVAVNSITSNPKSARVYDGQTKDTINAAFDKLTSDYIRNEQAAGRPISEDDAAFVTASQMNHPVPKYIDGINNSLLGGTVNEAKTAMEHMERLRAMTGFKTTGISDKARATGEVFNALKGQYPGDENEAMKQARDIVSNKKSEVVELNNTRIDAELNKHRSPNQLTSWAIGMGGLGSKDYENLPAFTANTVSQFRSFMQLTNGNVELSKKMTSENLEKLYAPSRVNGEKQVAYLPIETAMKIPSGGESLIQSDIVNNLIPQFAQSKASFNQGNSTSFWRVKEGRPTYEQYAEAKTKVDEALSFKGRIKAARAGTGSDELTTGKSDFTLLRESLSKERETIKKYQSASPVEVEQVLRGKRIEPTLQPKGFLGKGNIDLDNLPVLKNKDGTESTISTITAEMDGKTYLLPSVIDGKRVSSDEAVASFKKTKKHLGVFETQKAADLYDEALHAKHGFTGKANQWPKYYEDVAKTYTLNVSASNSTQVSGVSGEVLGPYNVGVKDPDTGITTAISGYFGGTQMNPEYRPNADWVRERYLSVNGLLGRMSFEEAWKAYQDRISQTDEAASEIFSASIPF